MTYQQFWNLVCLHLGVTPTRGNSRAFGVVVVIEGANSYWNPFNVTLPDTFPAYNSTGVRMFPTAQAGAEQTALFLLDNERWAPFVASLRNARFRYGPLKALARIYAEWGSHPDFLGVSKQQSQAVLDSVMS